MTRTRGTSSQPGSIHGTLTCVRGGTAATVGPLPVGARDAGADAAPEPPPPTAVALGAGVAVGVAAGTTGVAGPGRGDASGRPVVALVRGADASGVRTTVVGVGAPGC